LSAEPHATQCIYFYGSAATEKHAVVVATAAVDKHKQLKDVAQFIKHEMDHNFPAAKATEGVYHCVVGKSFASELHAGCASATGHTRM
jgi:dynein light chain LC8-type